MPIGIGDAPGTLPSHAKDIYVSAFNNSYETTCKKRKDRDACAAKIAWSAVKNKYKKGGEGKKWVAKSFNELEVDVGNIPLPGSLYESPYHAAQNWIDAYGSCIIAEKSIGESASDAWAVLKTHYECDSQGLWQIKDGQMIERASLNPEEEIVEAPEDAKAELVIVRSEIGGGSWRTEGGPIIVDGLTPEQEQALVDKYCNEIAARPEGFPGMAWASLALKHKTVCKAIHLKRRSRAYMCAVEREQKRGWTTYLNPLNPSEYIFSGWKVEPDKAQTLQRTVLVRSITDDGTKCEHWLLGDPLNFASATIQRDVGPDYARFRGPLLK